MPYMKRPRTDIPLHYGARPVIEGEVVLVADHDAAALEAEGWRPCNTHANSEPSAAEAPPSNEE